MWGLRGACVSLLWAFAIAIPQSQNAEVITTGFRPSNLPRNDIRPGLAWTTLEGRTADPCHIWTDVAEQQFQCKSVPDSQVTVLIPVETSTHVQQAAINAGTYTLTMFGRGFDLLPTNAAGAVGVVATALAARGCELTDNAAGMFATVTRISNTQLTFNVPQQWAVTLRELEDEPRFLCFSQNLAATQRTFRYTGFKIGVVWHCDPTVVATQCPPPPTAGTNVLDYEHLTFEQWRDRKARKTCCQSTLGNLRVGQCILSPSDNPLAPTSCCGGARIENSQERCCNAASELTAFHSTPCPCRRNAATICPTGENCCLPSKYTELNDVVDAVGECYNPTQHQCCDTGMRYDPGAQQCCVINGVQSNNVPCPCSADSHCWGGQFNATKDTVLRCCAQTNTTTAAEYTQCNIYANYPNGTSPYHAQRCLGSCFDPTYQICCNGVQCIKSYEKCCNNTCCNRFTQTCETAYRPGTPGNRFNFNGFMVTYETCSTIEQMQPIRALWIFILPQMFLLMTLLSTGLVLVFANKASSRSYAGIERAMINIALIAILASLVFYFSPAYKYTAVVVFVQLFTILTAAARIRYLNIWCVVLALVLVIYLVDPFHGSKYFTLASSRTTIGQADRDSAGLIHLVGKMYNNASYTHENNFCTSYYLGYFRLDPLLRDTDRIHDPNKQEFGYCERAYVLLLLVFAAVIYVCAFLQLILTILALLLRFTKPQVQLIVREAVEEPQY